MRFADTLPQVDTAANLWCPSCVEWTCGLGSLLTPPEASQLAAVSIRRQVTAGAELLTMEGLRDTCVAILRGVVKVLRLLSDGRQQIVALKAAPDLLGAPFMRVDDLSFRAVTDMEICCVPRSVFEALVLRNPALEHRLHLRVLQDLSAAEALLLTLGRKTARERIATFLLEVAGRLQPLGKQGRCSIWIEEGMPSVLDLPLTRAEIGDFLGLTFETVSRQFAALRRDGIIAFSDPRRITVKDGMRLQMASGS
ncbi:Crp/Fnr family transcriptional regulator [Tianweitania sediminis]|uniref:Crp/Fnr family transcriptional regulator n=1 Tax=Tianweitania sediminis TaxID=1502156 RepID=A0A8J7UFJ0_9HYPH|nr:Crp/Fnr family transcriptional regulator [Tianweitania sediminis]